MISQEQLLYFHQSYTQEGVLEIINMIETQNFEVGMYRKKSEASCEL